MKYFPLLFMLGAISVHAYLFWNLQRIFRNPVWQYYALPVLVITCSAIVLRRQLSGWSTIIAFFNIWLGVLFMITLGSLVKDTVELLALGLDRLAGTHLRPLVSGSRAVAAGLGLCLLLFPYSLYEAQNIGLRFLTVPTDKLPANVERLRIVALTDIHITPYDSPATIKRMVDLANAQGPDMTVVVGVDDPQLAERVSIPKALDKADPGQFILLLNHRPEIPPETVGRFDLNLSGHTHGGQIWPMRHLLKMIYGFGQGLTRLEAPAGRARSSSLIHVSNGTRFWGPPVRFLTPPEMTVLDIVGKKTGN